MPVPVKFVLSRRDLVPPIYLAGSFTQWQPNLMDVTEQTHDQGTWNEFTKTVELEPGVHEYKFRLGDGDWWITDDTHEQVTDHSGNVNNTINVQESQPPKNEEKPLVEESKPVPEVQSIPESQSLPEVKPAPVNVNDDADDKPSVRWSTRSKATSDDTNSSSNLTIVETSSLLKNRTTAAQQAETYDTIGAQNQERPSATSATETNGLDGSRSPVTGNAKGSVKPRSMFKRLFCFCSSTTGLGLAGFGTVLVAAYMIHSQVN